MKNTADAPVVAVRETFDGVRVNFHANGEVSFRTHFLRGRLTPLAIWRVADDVCLYTAEEIPALLRAAKSAAWRPFRVRVDIPESQRVYRVVKVANGLDVHIRVR